MKNKKEEKINNLKKEEKINNLKKEEKEKNDDVQNKIIDLLEIKLKKSQEKIINMQLKNHEEILKLNYRLNSDIEKSRKFSLEKVIIEFLPIIDNIERALSVIKDKKEAFYLEIINKMNFIFSLLEEILSEFNVSKINEKKISFDPEIHQAMSINYNDEIEDNHVVDVMQSGYMLHKARLLRPAMVIVSKRKNN
ncbi:nucleotide exchange factor GrpE [Buchnera aphidicola]|uniref:nucleotide exchange factor GrpE n=1 Tax=Buchnera aphidicola TaxID=9 RepID=UPI000D598A33|nr:nucleotide exchange factor GrpE [Buchnera aphidicola]AWI49700.1 nucleotide exchange factor GrpE [Buchnera aphidicola (Schizaphis graminum)]